MIFSTTNLEMTISMENERTSDKISEEIVVEWMNSEMCTDIFHFMFCRHENLASLSENTKSFVCKISYQVIGMPCSKRAIVMMERLYGSARNFFGKHIVIFLFIKSPNHCVTIFLLMQIFEYFSLHFIHISIDSL